MTEINITDVSTAKRVNRIHSCSPHDMQTTLQHYMEYVRHQLDAIMVSWVAGYAGKYDDVPWQAELLNGWKVMDNALLESTDHEMQQARDEYFAKAKQQGIDPLTRHALQNTGKTRVHSYADLNSNEEWTNHWISQEFLEKRNAGERLVGIYNLDAEAESYLVVYRPLGAEPFTQEDELKLYHCLIEFPRVHYWLFLERGLLSFIKRPTPPKLQKLIPLLMSGLTEPEIAEKMQLKRSTVHNYITELYRNYSVNSRHEFINLWLRATDTD